MPPAKPLRTLKSGFTAHCPMCLLFPSQRFQVFKSELSPPLKHPMLPSLQQSLRHMTQTCEDGPERSPPPFCVTGHHRLHTTQCPDAGFTARIADQQEAATPGAPPGRGTRGGLEQSTRKAGWLPPLPAPHSSCCQARREFSTLRRPCPG